MTPDVVVTTGRAPHRTARLLVVAAFLSACGSPDGKDGGDLAGEVEAVVQQYFDAQGLGWTVGSVSCEDVPVVEPGATATCDVELEQEGMDDFEVRVTMQDDAGNFEWHASGLLTGR